MTKEHYFAQLDRHNEDRQREFMAAKSRARTLGKRVKVLYRADKSQKVRCAAILDKITKEICAIIRKEPSLLSVYIGTKK